MYYEFEVTKPTKINSIETYKRRMREIIKGQLKGLVKKERFINPFFWILVFYVVPLNLCYAVLSLLEIVVNTLLLPIYLIPYLRGIAMFITIIIWSLGITIGRISLVDLTYSIDSTNLTASEKRVAENFIRSQELKNKEIEYLMPDDEQ